MNREETKKAIEVMQAYVDGEQIEAKQEGSDWRPSFPIWDWGPNDYRVKPKPIECWVTVLNGRTASTVHATEELANNCVHPELNNGWTVHKVLIE